MTDKPVLLVDGRQDKKFTRALKEHFVVVEKQLRVGDFRWTSPMGPVGVEDKCLADLAGSQTNKRLDDELRRLVENFAVPILFVRGYHDKGTRYRAHRDAPSIANTLLGRQFHGVYTYQVPEDFDEAAEALWRLHRYLALPRDNGIEGVRREAKMRFTGPMSERAEVIYGILGKTQGVRNRRGIAEAIAKDVTLSDFLKWDTYDFEACGFSRHMAGKLTVVLRELEVQP